MPSTSKVVLPDPDLPEIVERLRKGIESLSIWRAAVYKDTESPGVFFAVCVLRDRG